MQSFFSENKKPILSLVFIVGIFLILFHYTDTPKVWIDEGVYTETARNFAFHGVLGLQVEPGKYFPINYLLSTGYPVILPVATSLKLLGIGVWQARLPMVLYMIVLMFLFYLFAKRKYGFWSAVLSVLFLLSFSPFYGNGRPVQGEVPGLVFLVLGALCMLLWEEGSFQSKKWALFSGLAFGLAASTKPIYMLGLGVVIFISLLIWFKKINKKALVVFLTGILVPVVGWFFIQFPDKQSFLKLPGLYVHIASSHSSSVSTIQTVFTNLLRFFTESTPILFTILFITVAFSLVLQYVPKFPFFKNKIEVQKQTFSISESVILGFILLNFAGYLIGTGWYRYFFPAHTLLYLVFPASMFTVARCIKKDIYRKVFFLIPVCLLIFQFVHLIFLSDTSFTVKRTRNKELSAVLSPLDPSKKIFFYGAVDSIIFFKGNNYGQYLLMGDFLDTANREAFKDGTYDYIFAGATTSPDFILPCYDKEVFDKYFLFKKIKDCK